MRSRSWMAAPGWFVLAISSSLATPAIAVEPVVENAIELELQIDGLGASGAKIEIKAGHPGCEFTTIVKTIEEGSARSRHRLEPIKFTAKSTNADRDCSFVITIKEPGLPVKTIRRGLILRPTVAGQPMASQAVKWVVNSPSMAARDEKGKTRR